MAKYILKRFSSSSKKDDEEKKKNDNKNKDLNTILGLGGVGAGIISGGFIQDEIKKRKRDYSEESKALYNKLKDKYNGDLFDESDSYATIIPKIYKHRDASCGYLPKFKYGMINLDKSLKGDAGMLAHEMGHSYFFNPDLIKGEKSKDNVNKIGKFLHSKDFNKIKRKNLNVGITTGLISGINKARLERKGKKEGIINKITPYAITGVINAGEIGSELAASIKGYKMLKELGASKKVLNDTKKDLGFALSTYIGNGIITLGATKGSKMIGDRAAKLYYKYKDKKKQKEQNKEKEED
jgi:hypothetical protein